MSLTFNHTLSLSDVVAAFEDLKKKISNIYNRKSWYQNIFFSFLLSYLQDTVSEKYMQKLDLL